MPELLALSSALCFGVTHFVNGLVSRRYAGVVVAAYAQVGGTAVSLLLLAAPTGSATAQAVCWGAISGLGTGIGVAFLYRAMQRAPMSVVVPTSDVGAVTLPVAFGIALLGERPSPLALGGIVASIPAIWLVSAGERASRSAPMSSNSALRRRNRCSHAHRWFSEVVLRRQSGDPAARRRDPHRQRRASGGRGVPDALIAGTGFAVQFIGMGQVPAGTGWWPIIVSRIVSVVLIGALLAATTGARRLPAKPAATALLAGAIGTVAIILYLLATTQQMMAVAVVLAALYPAIPVILALLLLDERISRAQLLGLLCAAATIALLSLT
ncbi:DMT family transporter [Saccharopolyspora sp. K220]|uniref:EamA family transporter n=1 Tax=Saccharopolyspora soli TaxID=2926618 RepID=UPI001F57FE4B|nr:EamA family transporter [Saccharopolyspora soli]MCI2417042.1 DMT family transporter [Saccharopolyspora soli]